MTTFIALLRGINVGGHRKVAMAELRDVCAAAGLADVRSYVNSGNLVFSANGGAARQETVIEAAIAAHFGFPIDVMVRAAGDWAAYVRGNPIREIAEKHPNRVMLLAPKRPLSGEAVAALRAKASGEERVEQAGEVLWLYFAESVARSKLAAASPRGIPVTTRNWRTVLKLAEMAGVD
jgi:uncharacterized protein (DUF1697 family)